MHASYIKIKHTAKILISRYSLENEVINWFQAVEVGVILTAHASKAESRNPGIRVYTLDRKLGKALTAPSRANVAGLAGDGGEALPSRNYNTKCHNYRPNHTLF